MMTGMHAFHVITGILFLLVIYFNGRNGRYTPERHWMVEAAPTTGICRCGVDLLLPGALPDRYAGGVGALGGGVQ
jgi:hypothetical protein